VTIITILELNLTQRS